MGGITAGVSGIGGLGGGINAQYIQGAGWNLYGYAGVEASNDVGFSATGNIGTLYNPQFNPAKRKSKDSLIRPQI